MGRIIVAFLAGLWLLYIGIMYASEAVLLLSFGIMIFLVLSVADLVVRFFSIKAKIEVPISVAEIGDHVSVQVNLRNGSIFAIAKLRYDITTRNLFLKGLSRQKVFGETVIPGGNVLSYEMVPMEPGNYEIELRNIYIYNLTGTFYIRKRIRKCAYLQVNPEFTSMNLEITEATKNYYGEGDTYHDLRAGKDPGETFQVREFRNGDKIQKIHWKLSAKLDELMVKEDSDPISAPVVFFLNYETPKKKKQDHVSAYLGMIGSFSFSMLDKKCFHYVSWYSVKRKDVVRVRICDEESFFFMFAAYLADSYEESPKQIREMYKDKYRGEHYLYEFSIDGNLRFIQNGRLLLQFHEKTWKEEAEKMEIIL